MKDFDYDIALITDERSLYTALNTVLDCVPVVNSDLEAVPTSMVFSAKLEPDMTEEDLDGFKKEMLDTAYLTVAAEAHRGGHTRIWWRKAPEFLIEEGKLLLRFRYLLLPPEETSDEEPNTR